MIVYYILILLILLPGIITGSMFTFDSEIYIDGEFKRYRNSTIRKNYAIYCGVLIFIVTAFRDYSVGTDTLSYMTKFTGDVGGVNLGYFISSLIPSDLNGIKRIFEYEVGYRLYNIILNDLGFSSRVFLIVTSAFCVYAASRFIYKYSSNIGLGFFVHVTIGSFCLSLSGIRQVVAISFVMLAYEQARKKHIIKYLLLILLAISFHYSSIIMLPLYAINLVKFKRPNKKMIVAIPVCFVALWFIFRNIIFWFIENYAIRKYVVSGYLDEGIYETNFLVYVFAFGICATCVVGYVLSTKEIKNDDLQYIVIASLFVVTNLLSSMIFMAGRLTYYFLIIFVIALPNALSGLNKKLRVLSVIALIVIGIAYFSITVPGSSIGIDSYKFGW